MGMDRAWKDEFTLLCERCGYVVEGLPPEGACPECGKPIVESLPERRPGTIWQNRSEPRPFLRTLIQTLLHPIRTLETIAVNPRRDHRLMVWSNMLAACLFSMGWWSTGLLTLLAEQPAAFPVWAVVVVVTAFALFGLLWVLTLVESWGLRVIARGRCLRISADLSRSITAHGCVGWVVGGTAFFIFNLTADSIMNATRYDLASDPDAPQMFRDYIIAFGNPPAPWSVYLAWLLRTFAMLGGFLFFETFAWLGLRRLKYANRVRPGMPTSEGSS